MSQAIRYLSLFSGIGAHDLGFERAGWQCVGQVEFDPFCTAVLERHWPNVPRWSDVRDVRADDVVARCGSIDLITGGFACQDISLAGRGDGLTRVSRSGVTFRNLFRLARGVRPAWLVIENVPALRTRGYDRVARVLERLGYAVAPFVVGAGDLGAPHKRKRVWIVGQLKMADSGDPRLAQRWQLPGSTGEKLARAASCRCSRELADADGGGSGQDSGYGQLRTSGAQQSPSDSWNTYAAAIGEDSRWPARPGEEQHEWEQPRTIEPALGRAASRAASRLDGFARRHALKALGNCNPPACAELIARTVNRAIVAMESEVRP